MNNSNETDIQCSQILKGLDQLDKYLEEPIAKDALNLDENFSTNKNRELLKRLRMSLIQYKERGRDLVYVGFMGHFSTGKSSTINSLLDLDKQSEGYRNIGLNPVDKAITLITHSKNNSSILNITKEGLVAIKSSSVDNDFLHNVVIADTPGTGDPVLLDEIARDFLPICDLIIYFFSSTNPLDTADQPFLQEKFSELNFIPTKFVVTRADEFRLDSECQLNEQNFDDRKAGEFLGTLVYRINQLFKDSNAAISSEDIILIDNRVNFNIDSLKTYISKFADIEDISGQIRIHSHKIRYYQSSSITLQGFFSNFINNKFISISNFVENAKKNIKKFNDEIQITNNSLTQSWFDSLGDIRNVCNKVINSLPDTIIISNKISDFNSDKRMQKTNLLKSQIKSESKESIKSWSGLAKQETLRILNSQLSQLKIDINEAKIPQMLKDPSCLHLSLSNIKLESFLKKEMDSKIPQMLVSESRKMLHSVYIEKFNETRKELGKRIKYLKDELQQKRPSSACEEIINKAEIGLSEDFDKFFNIIYIYRSGVFSLNVKDAIAKLGMEMKLDELDSKQIPDEQKLIIKQNAKENIFPDKAKVFSDFKQRTTELDSTCLHLQRSFDIFYSKDMAMPDIDWPEEDLDAIISELARDVRNDVSSFQQSINNKLQSNVSLALERWEIGLRAAKRKRRNYFITVALVTAVLYFVAYSGFLRFQNIDVSSNVSSTIFWGIITSIVFEFISFLVALARDSYPRDIKVTETKILEDFRQTSFETIEQEISSFKDEDNEKVIVSAERLSNFLYDSWQTALVVRPQESHFTSTTSLFQEFVELNNGYSNLLNDYHDAIEALKDKASSYFAEPEKNISKLREITNSLKQESVDPSFELLAATKNILHEVKQKIDAIEFL